MTYTILWTQRPGGNVSGGLMRRASYVSAPSMAGALGEFLRNPPANAVVQAVMTPYGRDWAQGKTE